jgi:hypothetical protein
VADSNNDELKELAFFDRPSRTLCYDFFLERMKKIKNVFINTHTAKIIFFPIEPISEWNTPEIMKSLNSAIGKIQGKARVAINMAENLSWSVLAKWYANDIMHNIK